MPNRRADDAKGRGAGAGTPGSPPPADRPLASRITGDPAFPWELPHVFLGLDEVASSLDRARAVVLPVPYEATTSYGAGTREGPQAILEASKQLAEAAGQLSAEPVSLHLRYLQTLVEIAAEKNSTVIFPVPIDWMKALMGPRSE